MVESNSTFGGCLRNRGFGGVAIHRLCIGVRFLVVDSRSFQGAREMVGVILHAER